MTQSLDWFEDRHAPGWPRGGLDEKHGRDKRDRHEHGDPEERASPADPAQLSTDERAQSDSHPERGLVEDDGPREPAGRGPNDDR
jgi:hypothetical protein